MQNSNFNAAFEIKLVAESGIFEGYASVFNIVDKVKDRIVKGAFKDSLEKFSRSGSMPPLLWQHNAFEPIGVWHEMYEDDHGLFVKGELFINELATAREAYKLLKEKVVTGLSIGYLAINSYRDEKQGVRVLTKVDLQEISLVTFPANEYARVSNFCQTQQIPSERELESILRNSGFSRRQAKGVVACGYKGLQQGTEDEEIKRLVEIINKATEETIRKIIR